MIKTKISLCSCLIVLLFWGSSYLSHAQNFNVLTSPKVNSWLILNTETCTYNETWFDEWIHSMKGIYKLGIITHIVTDTISGELHVKLDNNINYRLADLLNQINKFLEEEGKQFTIIYNADYNTNSLINKVSSSLAKELNYTYKQKNYTLDNIFKNEKLIWFSMHNHTNKNNTIHLLNNFIQKQSIINPCNKTISSFDIPQGSILFDLEHLKQETHIKNTERARFKQKQVWLNAIFNNWYSTGIQPVFIVMNTKKHYPTYKNTIRALQKTTSINGVITNYADVPINNILWEHNNFMQTNGLFNFPIRQMNQLKPYKAGYEFHPNSYDISIEDINKQFYFKAQALPINEALKLNISFNDNKVCKPSSNHEVTRIIKDRGRGSVLSVIPNSELPIGNVSDYEIANNSFTISFWIKTYSSIPRNCNIIGNNTRERRKGLHITIRDNKPYFGFYDNDIWSDFEIKPYIWNHCTFVYDKTLKQQSIYINGNLSKTEPNKLSFIGQDTLFIGRAININTTYPFLLDDLNIWNRALNAKEIKKLDKTLQSKTNRTNLILLFSSIFIALAVFYYLKRKQVSIPLPNKQNVELKNAILVFGQFSLLDRQRNDVSLHMPPLAKEIFTLLLCACFSDKKGLETQELSNHFWDDLPTAKARNNRNVAIAKLRKCIENIEGLSIEYEKKTLHLKIEKPCYCDYIEAKECANKIETNQANKYYSIVKRGMFLPFTDWNWLTDFKTQYNDEVIENLSIFLIQAGKQKQIKLQEQICRHILSIDDLHPKACYHLIQILCKTNRLTLAKSYFNRFSKTYFKAYNEQYKYSFDDFREIPTKQLDDI
ncbi:LamG domain-containing protein [Saccharicrinis aurantiacus]|uniref:LamG domain-containing protein n=1 Tax=Saccharicrinis aurantiacus TaxID=1849719 RepID=UPI0015C536D4|nr:LamG-like jellyroll fold domain-containing protein [Saccharicrinis aurantiacus]